MKIYQMKIKANVIFKLIIYMNIHVRETIVLSPLFACQKKKKSPLFAGQCYLFSLHASFVWENIDSVNILFVRRQFVVKVRMGGGYGRDAICRLKGNFDARITCLCLLKDVLTHNLCLTHMTYNMFMFSFIFVLT